MHFARWVRAASSWLKAQDPWTGWMSKGDGFKAVPIRDGFRAPTSVTRVGSTAWVSEGQLSFFFDGRCARASHLLAVSDLRRPLEREENAMRIVGVEEILRAVGQPAPREHGKVVEHPARFVSIAHGRSVLSAEQTPSNC